MKFKVILGDITKVTCDAIANAANTTLLGGGGVDGAIHRAAGPELLSECRTLGGCRTGEAKITNGYRLPVKYVIQLLKNCYENCLKLAAEHGCKSIAFPSISTGIYGFPLEKAAPIAVHTIRSFLKEHPEIEKVQMVCFDEITKKYYENALDG